MLKQQHLTDVLSSAAILTNISSAVVMDGRGLVAKWQLRHRAFERPSERPSSSDEDGFSELDIWRSFHQDFAKQSSKFEVGDEIFLRVSRYSSGHCSVCGQPYQRFWIYINFEQDLILVLFEHRSGGELFRPRCPRLGDAQTIVGVTPSSDSS